MKKFLFLVTVALSAMSVNAQEIWDASSLKDLNQTSKDGVYFAVDASKITKEEHISSNGDVILQDEYDVLPYPGEGKETDPSTIMDNSSVGLTDYIINAETENVSMKFTITPNLGEEDAEKAFTFGLGVNPNEPNNNRCLSTDKCSPKFLDYIRPKSGNASIKHIEWWEKNADNDDVHKVKDEFWTLNEKKIPAISANMKFTSKSDGTLKVGIFVNKNIQNNPIYVLDVNNNDGTYTILPATDLKYEGYTNNNTTNPENQDSWLTGTAKENYVVPTELQGPFLGYLSFDMKANKTYMIFIVKSQIGLYGYQFTPNGAVSGINDITVNAENSNANVYNLVGQRVSKDANGILIKNGKKFIQKQIIY